MGNGYDRKTLVILRAALIAIGAAVGGTALWQYFVYYPNVLSKEFQIVIIVVSAAVAAALLGLSAKPFYRLGSSLREKYRQIFSGLGARGIIAVSLGCIAAIALTVAINIGLMRIVEILAVRILADILICIAFAFLLCYVFSRLLSPKKTEEKIKAPERGYLITAPCFYDDRVYSAVDFLSGVCVSDSSAKALFMIGEPSAEAIDRYRKIMASGKVKIIRDDAAFETAESYMRAECSLADEKRLKIISFDIEGYPRSENSLAVFAMPSAEVVAGFNGANEEKKDGEAQVESLSDDGTRGQIIIDK